MRSFLIIAFLFLSSGLQAQLIDRVLAAPDYRGEGGIAVKWLTEKGVYPGGFRIYRKQDAALDWKMIGTSIKQEPNMERLKQMNTTLVQSYAVFYEKEFDYLQTVPAHRAVLYLNLSRSQEISEMLGMVYYDEDASQGSTYQYRVTGVLNDNEEEEIGLSPAVQPGVFAKLSPPDSISVQRFPDQIWLNWKIDETVSTTSVIERSVDGGAYTQVSELPLYVSKSQDSLGNWVFPPVFFADTDIDSMTTYQYRLAAVDYFAQTGEFSEAIVSKPVDFVFPPTPQGATIAVDDRAMMVQLDWEYPAPPDDLKGFVVLSRKELDQVPTVISDTLAQLMRSSAFQVDGTGEYLFTIGAIDEYGNLSESMPLVAKVDDMLPPDLPTDVEVRWEEGISILNWQESPSADIRGYFIYRAIGEQPPADEEGYKIVNSRPYELTQFVDTTGAPLAGSLWYAVAAVDSSYNISQITTPTTFVIPDETAPQAPFMKAPLVGEDVITLEWMQNVDSDLEAWLIHRQAAEDTIIIEVAPEMTRYVDTDVSAGKTYRYVMEARDIQGNVSPRSNVVELVAPGIDKSIFKGIEPKSISLKFVKKSKNVTLDWTQTFNGQNLGVIVYKGTDKDDLRPYSGRLQQAGFTDERIQSGTTYYYQLRTYASNGLNIKSDIKEIKIKAEEK